ncbi:hypothetical protein L6R52_09545 [Myxococcota bacterium]|nr:hypothetical protein [Myxococcota bacterium]
MGVRELLATRRGLVAVPAGEGRAPENLVRAIEVRVAELGFALSSRLRARLTRSPIAVLDDVQRFLVATLSAATGAHVTHTPLFRKFPDDVPADTLELWVRKVLVHFVQGEDQPCLFCRQRGTTHVLSPCRHVVCDRCFDGSNYSACPVCEHVVDRSSPFFRPAADQVPSADERVRFRLLDLVEDVDAAARELFVQLVSRTQVMSPDDVAALVAITTEHGARILDVLPAEIPVKENRAHVFGTLLRTLPLDAVLGAARPHLTTATDVLRVIAVWSGADPGLIPQASVRLTGTNHLKRWFAPKRLDPDAAERFLRAPRKVIQTERFRVVKLSRPARRALLALLEGLPFESLVEDLRRHVPAWRAVGEALHPFEYSRRYPKAALAFAVIRGTELGDDTLGRTLRAQPELATLERRPTGALTHVGFHAKVDRRVRAGDVEGALAILSHRPGELGRRVDHLARLAVLRGARADAVVDAYACVAPSLATPMLVQLSGHFPHRTTKAPARVYWPKGQVGLAPSSKDRRPVLSEELAARFEAVTLDALLDRFAEKPRVGTMIVDDALASLVAPFNERTSSPSAIPLPRGSRVSIDGLDGAALLRLFLHWCEPAGGHSTDLDLSIAFFDGMFGYSGVCSYYALRMDGQHVEVIATSSGDRRNAPPPDGGTELVDLDLAKARREGLRWAVMVVTAYSGLPFDALERAFAGVMLRDDAHGAHFDPRKVLLKFALTGQNGVFMPMAVDLERGVLHWLDLFAAGQAAFNNVATAYPKIRRLVAELVPYFESGTRPSMRDLALLHAAARADRVLLRGETLVRELVRRPREDTRAFHTRLRRGIEERTHDALPPLSAPVLAALFRGDVELPEKSDAYVLFPEKVHGTLAASDLLR